MEKEVLVIFKTHLDIGFTDLSENVVHNYFNSYIPNAVKIGYELKDSGCEFIWTTGSWLIWNALKQDDGSLEQAIRDNIIKWHGLPFTTHTELMTPELFEYGLSLSGQMDKRFGKTTTGAKMTDVPGHTIGMVPLMQKHGLTFLHIGVNPATPLPDVPPLFRWKCDDTEITVMYQGDYGEPIELEDFIIYFAHTGDNLGPQSADAIRKLYSDLRQKYPGYTVKAATLDDVAQKLSSMKNLPVIDKEIGDTWIHGAGTDPKKLSMFRSLQRTFSASKCRTDISDSLLVIPEHTWGRDIKLCFPDDTSYFPEDFEKTEGRADRLAFERSWQEQREYIALAEKQMNTTAAYPAQKPDLNCFIKTAPQELDVEISWQLFDHSDYERYQKVYMRLTEENKVWSLWDFTKKGLPAYQGGIQIPRQTACYRKDNRLIAEYRFDEDAEKYYGLPYFVLEKEENKFTLKWFDKKALRLPNAFWMKFTGMEENWEIRKMGRWISPDEIIGSPLISATDYGVRNENTEIKSPDAALIAPFGRRLLDFEKHPQGQNLYFNLYNNIWNTNFPMWYSDDAVFRFQIKNR